MKTTIPASANQPSTMMPIAMAATYVSASSGAARAMARMAVRTMNPMTRPLIQLSWARGVPYIARHQRNRVSSGIRHITQPPRATTRRRRDQLRTDAAGTTPRWIRSQMMRFATAQSWP
jgi:hypothetical protein